MTTQVQTAGKAPAAASVQTAGMPQSEFERLLLKDSKSKVEFTPFGATDKITLSVKIIKDYIAVPYKQGDRMVEPEDRECMKFLMLCRSRALNPFEGDAFMIPFWDKHQGKPVWSLITSHQAFLKRGEVHPEYDGKRSGVIINAQRCKPCDGDGRITEGEKVVVCPHCAGRGWYDELEGDFVPDEIDGNPVELKGGWCRIYFKGRKNPEYQRLRLSTYSKGFGNWSFDGAGMICKCAEAAAMRGAFPTTLGGMYMREEMMNEEPGGALKGPDFSRATKPSPGKQALFSPPEAEPPQRLPDEPAEPPAAEAPAAEPPPQAESAKPPPPPPASEQPGGRYLRAVRQLCKAASIPEATLLQMLAEIGLTDGDIGSLEDLAMSKGDVLKQVHDRWADFSKRILSVLGRK